MFSYGYPYQSTGSIFHDPYHTSCYPAPARYTVYPSYARVPSHETPRGLAQQRARALAQQRARSQYLVPEFEDQEDDDYPYSGYGYSLTPREQAYLQAARREEIMERKRREEMARLRLIEEERREKAKQEQAQEMMRRRLEAKRENEARQSLEQLYRALRGEQQDPQPQMACTQSPPSPRTPSPSTRRSIPIHTPPSTPPRSQSPVSRPNSPPAVPSTQPPAVPTPTESPTPETQEAAATTIQAFFRTSRSLRAIKALESQFDKLKAEFVRPSQIDFKIPTGELITVSTTTTSRPASSPNTTYTAKLAFTPTNVPLHTYIESLSRLLVKLDGVESYGAREVRERRKGVVKRVEAEAGDVEEFWKQVWEKYLGELEEGSVASVDVDLDDNSEEGEVISMVIDSAEEGEEDPEYAPSTTQASASDHPQVDMAVDDSEAPGSTPTSVPDARSNSTSILADTGPSLLHDDSDMVVDLSALPYPHDDSDSELESEVLTPPETSATPVLVITPPDLDPATHPDSIKASDELTDANAVDQSVVDDLVIVSGGDKKPSGEDLGLGLNEDFVIL